MSEILIELEGGDMGDERLPWIKFYPQDWSGDEELSMCSLAARGLLAAFLHLMHKAEPYGHLLLFGRIPSSEDLAKFARCKPSEVKVGLEELIQKGALSRTPDNVVFSRRMVRDAERRKRCTENGRKSQLNSPPHNVNLAPPTYPHNSQSSGPGPMASGLWPLGSSGVISDSDDSEFQRKVGDVAELYPRVFLRVRQAHYQPKPVRDYPNFQDLARGWPLDRLEKMIEVFLLMPAKEAHNIPGTPGQFSNMAPECDRRLRENGL
jgi:hypothetical protein